MLMTEIKASDYLIFFELLLDKFAAEFNPPYLDKYRTSLWAEMFKSPTKQKESEYKQKYGDYYEHLIVEVLFDLEGDGQYFLDAYQKALQEPKEFKINSKRLYKALLYLKEKSPFNPDKQKKQKILDYETAKSLAKQLWNEFRENYVLNRTAPFVPSHPLAKKKLKSHFDKKGTVPDTYNSINSAFTTGSNRDLLSFITSSEEPMQPDVIKSLTINFLNALSSNSKYDAWLLLTPFLQLHSIWCGDFQRFNASFFGVKFIEVTKWGEFSFQRKKVNFKVGYNEKGILYDIPSIIRKSELGFEGEGHTSALVVHTYESLMSNCWSNAGPDDRFRLIDPKEYTIKSVKEHRYIDPSFQKAFLIALKKMFRFPAYKNIEESTDEYDENFIAKIEFEYWQDRWLISDVEISSDPIPWGLFL